MNLTKKLVAAFAAMTVLAAPIAAAAQDAVVLFIDEGKLMATSKAGQSISAQMNALAADAEKDVKAKGQAVQDEGKKLQDAKDSLSKEDFAKRYQALLGRAQEVGQYEKIKNAELAQSRAKALTELNDALQPVVKDILEKRKATVLLERRAVVYADDDMDITDEIVKALDRKVKTIKVEKVDLIAQMQAAQKNQQKKKK